MSIPTQPTVEPSREHGRGPTPSTIDRGLYPALDQLRQHCARGGVTLIDRVYAEAQVLHQRALDAEAEVDRLAGPMGEGYPDEPATRMGEDLL